MQYFLKCHDCGNTCEVASYISQRVRRENAIWRCPECMKVYRKKISSEISRKFWDNIDPDEKKELFRKLAEKRRNRSPEEKRKTSEKFRNSMKNRSPEAIAITKEKLSKSTKKFWDGLSDEERKELCKKFSIGQREYQKQLDPEEKARLNKRRSITEKAQWKNMDAEERESRLNKMIAAKREFFKNASPERLKELSDKISKRRISYWERIGEEGRRLAGSRHKEWWDTFTEEERREMCQPMREGYENWWKNLTPEEREEYSKKVSIQFQNYWNNMTEEELNEHLRKRSEGFNDYLSRSRSDANKSELSMMSILASQGLDYEFQYRSRIKHERFDELFNKNNLPTGFKYTTPYHAWDFLIHTMHGDILIDIDGSIHDPNGPAYEVTLSGGRKANVREHLAYKDSQRPYQTDGLEAYVILCYDDNLQKTTPVISLCNDELITLNDLINILNLYNMDQEFLASLL